MSHDVPVGVLDGKSAVVTGGSRGIGRAVVERLARDGAEVTFSYARDEVAAADVEAGVAAAGGRAWAVRADQGDSAQTSALFDAAQTRSGGVDIVVANAASIATGLIADTTDAQWDDYMAVNLRGTFQVIREAARRLPDSGRLITVSSVNTVLPAPGIGLYAAAKGALEQLTAVAARELGARGITANIVSPGATDTDMLRTANPAETVTAMASMSPLGRLGTPADVADVVAFLAGPDGRWLTGQNLHASGGLR